MSRLRIVSDLHLEFGPIDLDPAGEDILVLAGDIGIYIDGLKWAIETTARLGVPAVMVAGNHEFYRNHRHPAHTMTGTILELQRRSRGTDVRFLDDDVAIVGGVRFIGATLWTDFALLGDTEAAKATASERMNDYAVIARDERSVFTPSHAAWLHGQSRDFIGDASKTPFDGETVVLTHHAPSRRSLAGRYANPLTAPAYASNLDDLVASCDAALWVHGHIHHSNDYMIGTTRVVSNPRGYAGYEVNPRFDPGLVIDI